MELTWEEAWEDAVELTWEEAMDDAILEATEEWSELLALEASDDPAEAHPQATSVWNGRVSPGIQLNKGGDARQLPGHVFSPSHVQPVMGIGGPLSLPPLQFHPYA